MSSTPDTNQLLAGRYRLLQALGSGGFGDTYLATDEQLPSGRQVVVKRLRPLKDDEPSRDAVTAAFRREARLLERVGRDHDQIPELFAYFEEDGAYWLVQEFVPGATLDSLGRISGETARQLLADLLPVLTFLHGRNLLHRDLKPDNIILREGDRKPVLIDFGAVRETMSTVVLATGASASSLVIGTQGYMPPEQAAGRPIFSSDLYALALTLISLLTGKSPQELPSDPVSGAVLWRNEAPGIDPTLADLLDRAIQPIPAQRFPTAQAMLEALGPLPAPAPATPPAPVATVTQATVVVAPQPPNNPVTPQPLPAPVAPSGYAPAPAAATNNSMVAIALSGFGLIVAVALGLGALFISQQNQQQAQLSAARQEAQQARERQRQLEKEKADAEAQRKAAEAQQAAESQAGAEIGLTRTQAVDLVNRWLGSKSQIFAPPYDPSAAASVVTGTLWQDLVKQDGPVGWLRNNNSYYTYTASRVDEVLSYDASGARPSLRVKIHEERTLHTPTGIDPAQSGVTDAVFTYFFEQENGTWMVADYTKG